MTKKQKRDIPNEIISAELKEIELHRSWEIAIKNGESWEKSRPARFDYIMARLRTLKLKRNYDRTRKRRCPAILPRLP